MLTRKLSTGTNRIYPRDDSADRHYIVLFKKYFSDYIELLETDHVIAPKSTKD